MAEVPIPFTEQEVDTDDDATSIVLTVGLVIAGFALLAWARGVGDYLASQANSFITNMLGFDPTSGEDQGADLV
jgi:hypothetical protein